MPSHNVSLQRSLLLLILKSHQVQFVMWNVIPNETSKKYIWHMCALFLWKSLTILPTFHSSQLSPGAKAWLWWVARRSRRWSHILSWSLTTSHLSLSFKFSIYFHEHHIYIQYTICSIPFSAHLIWYLYKL